MDISWKKITIALSCILSGVILPVKVSHAQVIFVATTTVTVSRCGDSFVNGDEQCDTGTTTSSDYSTSILGRNCMANCKWAPYCGDNIMQSIYSEQCDDGNNSSGDFCTDACKAETILTSGGGAGGGGSFSPGSTVNSGSTQVTISGKAYPNSSVNILKDGKVIGVVSADTKADFLFTADAVTPGTATFGFWAEDPDGLRSISFTTTFEVIQSAVTTISGILLPPTISIDKRSVKKGEKVKITGTSAPEVTIKTYIHSPTEQVQATSTSGNGKWVMNVDTTSLEEDVHTAKALFEIKSKNSVIQSGFSQAITFFVGDKAAGKVGSADLNGDGKVNLIDFSILLFNWGKPNTIADLNFDNTVNITDFSILIFNWTG